MFEMAESAQTVDELIVALVGMGFVLEDCQLAIENGKLSAQEIIEWIFAGKPESTPKPPVLRLGQPSDINNVDPGLLGLPDPAVLATEVAGACGTESSVQVAADDVPLVSRLNRSEEQRQWKIKYQEKLLQETKKQIQADKIAKKKAREDVLKLIQEDREKVKMSALPTGSCLLPDSLICSGGVSNQSASLVGTIIQMRLVDGKTLKQSFPVETLLGNVRDFVRSYCPLHEDISLLQPFPRVEFNEADMSRSLKELGLVPSGSLVIKLDTKAAEDPGSLIGEEEMGVSAVQSKKQKTLSPLFPCLLPSSHKWSGNGNRLGGEDMEQKFSDQQNHEDDMESLETISNSSNEMEAEDDQDIPVLPPPPQNLPVFPGHHPGLLAPPIIGVGGYGGLGGHNNVTHQHDWGFGNKLAGETLENVILPHHKKDPKEVAAEAARHRYEVEKRLQLRQPQEPAVEVRESPNVISVTLSQVLSLQDILIKFISAHVCNARSPIVGLNGIPADVATPILNYLVKQRMLKPNTLQMFISCRMQKIVLEAYPLCTNELLRVLRHHSYLKHLNLSSCELINEKGLQSLTGLKTLRHLNLSGCKQLTDACIPALSAMKSLVVLILEYTSITDSGIQMYALSSPPQLQYLDLSQTAVSQAIFMHLSDLPLLKKLNLEKTQITGLSGIQKLTRLVELNISNTQIVTDSFLCLTCLTSLISLNCSNSANVDSDVALSYLSKLPLKELQLPNRLTTTDVAVMHIKNMKMTVLDLTNFVYITDAAMKKVAEMRMLKILRLGNTKVTDAGLSCLAGLTGLEELDLSRTAVTNNGVKFLQGMTLLRELNLSNTGISNGFLTYKYLKPCTELRKLNISKNRISSQGILSLQLPNLQMLNIDETFINPSSLQFFCNCCPQLQKVIYRTLNPPPQDEEDFE